MNVGLPMHARNGDCMVPATPQHEVIASDCIGGQAVELVSIDLRGHETRLTCGDCTRPS